MMSALLAFNMKAKKNIKIKLKILWLAQLKCLGIKLINCLLLLE